MNVKELEQEINNLITNYTLEKVKENLYLTKYQQQVLKEKNIPYLECKDLTELIFLLSENYDDEEIETIIAEIEEFHYYQETQK